MSDEQPMREMTLDEWVEKLPEYHRARRELTELRAIVPSEGAKYTVRKVFNGLDAPRDVWETVSLEQNNDSYRDWWIGDGAGDPEKEAVDKWLLESGAKEKDRVLILISW